MYDTDVGICRPGKWKLLILLLQKAVRHVLAELLFVWEKDKKCNSSARAIRKTALTCFLRLRRCFPHVLALSSSVHQKTDFYASINPSSDDRRLNC